MNAGISAVIGQDFNQPWFGDPDTALESIIVLDAWTTSGTMMLFYLAALQSIPTDVYEAAAIDGGGVWRTFWRITFPLLKPAHFFVAVVSVIGALKLFDQAFIISDGLRRPGRLDDDRRCSTSTASRSRSSTTATAPRSASSSS